WVATGVAVVVILGIAFGISAYIRNKNTAPAPQIAQIEEPAPVVEEPVTAPEPILRVEAPAPQTDMAPLTPVEKPAPVVANDKPQLMLGNIAGKLKMSSAGIMGTGRLSLD